jgi:AraC-like DNA-binding protein
MINLELVIVTGLVSGALAILVLLFNSAKIHRNNIFLALSLFFIWYTTLILWITVNRQIFNVPYLYRTGALGGYLNIPFLYIFSRNSFYPGATWKKKDFYLLLPALFFVIDMMPMFLMPSEAKIPMIEQVLSSKEMFVNLNDGWITKSRFHIVFRFVYAFFCWVMISRLIIRNRRFETSPDITHNRPMFKFIVTYAIISFISILPGLFGAFLKKEWLDINYLLTFTSLSLLFSACYIFFMPRVLYGFFPAQQMALSLHADVESQVAGLPSEAESEPSDKGSPASVEQSSIDFEGIVMQIDKHMAGYKSYLKPRYTIHDLSMDTMIPVYILSPVINQKLGMNFNNWLNKYRLEYFMTLLEQGRHKDETLDALSKHAGFSSRPAFINAFKKHTGVTPGVYARSKDA